jgi:hypothetical protein
VYEVHEVDDVGELLLGKRSLLIVVSSFGADVVGADENTSVIWRLLRACCSAPFQ